MDGNEVKFLTEEQRRSMNMIYEVTRHRREKFLNKIEEQMHKQIDPMYCNDDIDGIKFNTVVSIVKEYFEADNLELIIAMLNSANT